MCAHTTIHGSTHYYLYTYMHAYLCNVSSYYYVLGQPDWRKRTRTTIYVVMTYATTMCVILTHASTYVYTTTYVYSCYYICVLVLLSTTLGQPDWWRGRCFPRKPLRQLSGAHFRTPPGTSVWGFSVWGLKLLVLWGLKLLVYEALSY